MAVTMALMNDTNPVWTKRLDGIGFVLPSDPISNGFPS